MFYGLCKVANPVGDVIGELPDPKPFDLESVKAGGETFIALSTVALRRKTALRFPFHGGPWQKNGIEDWRLWVDMGTAGKTFFFTKKALSAYRYSPEGLSQKRDEGIVSRMKSEHVKRLSG